ncbi:GIY-YIG nuclease family protein [Leifsonia bigeumensis]|uniref:GIY-YIG nuclease family protein n=1 Tax=Leifsonella bigeumensis TaxID=433643 RepID=A0ABP7FK47_9MICO
MPHVYILRCSDDSYYVGSTVDLEQRIQQHSMGLGAEYTKRRLPVILVFAYEYERVADAFTMEKRIQGWSRRKREALIEGRYNDLPALSRKDFSRRRGSSTVE